MFIVISQVKEMKCDSEFSKCDHSVHMYIRKSVIPKHICGEGQLCYSADVPDIV